MGFDEISSDPLSLAHKTPAHQMFIIHKLKQWQQNFNSSFKCLIRLDSGSDCQNHLGFMIKTIRLEQMNNHTCATDQFNSKSRLSIQLQVTVPELAVVIEYVPGCVVCGDGFIKISKSNTNFNYATDNVCQYDLVQITLVYFLPIWVLVFYSYSLISIKHQTLVVF